MRGQHPTEKEIVQFVLDQENCEPDVAEHINACEKCRTKAETYQITFEGMNNLPTPAFDFDLSVLVMKRIEVKKAGYSMTDMLIYSISALSAISLIFIFIRYVAPIFSQFTVIGTGLVIIITLMVSVFLLLESYKKHRRQMNELDLL